MSETIEDRVNAKRQDLSKEILSKQTSGSQSSSGSKPLLVVRSANCQQETYETGSLGLKARAKRLRDLGYRVIVSSMGSQITPWGAVKCTLLTVEWPTSEMEESLDRPEYLRRTD